MQSVFSFEDYKKYLRAQLDEQDKNGRGSRSRLAKEVGCQSSYLSQVLNGKPDFTPEQAHRVSRYFGHTKVEASYFLLLVDYARATTQDLKAFLLEQIRERQSTRFDLKKRLSQTEELPESARNKYYSAWFVSAIHIALAVPKFRDHRLIARQLNLPERVVLETIDFLKDCGLIRDENGRYEFTKKRIHLERDSDFIQRHHINWRSQVLQSVEKNLPEDLHYSLVFAIAESDIDPIREVLVQAVESARRIIRPSASEKVCAMTIDFFGV